MNIILLSGGSGKRLCNDYHTFFPSWLQNYNESSLWDFQKAIVYASIDGAQ